MFVFECTSIRPVAASNAHDRAGGLHRRRRTRAASAACGATTCAARAKSPSTSPCVNVVLVDDVRAEVLVHQRRALGIAGLDRIDERLEQLVVDLDQRERVLGEVARLGDGDRHRLAGVADLLDRDRVLDDLLGAEARQRVDDLGQLGAA